MTGFAWGLLFGAFFSIILVIYWLTEKPVKKTRSEYTLPPLRVISREERQYQQGRMGDELLTIEYKPPEVIGTIDLGVKNKLTKPKE